MASTYGASQLKSSGPSISMAETSVGIGNYKGVMLCNRPFGGTAVSTKKAGGGDSKATFNCGVVAESLGQNVPISAAQKQIKRPNKESCLAKHKKWLSDLQKQKDKLEIEYLEQESKKQADKQKFQEHEKKLRQATRAITQSESKGSDMDVADGKDYYDEGPETRSVGSEEKAQAKHSSTGKPLFKPAWALSETAANQQNDDKAQFEDDELLDFARSVDFDKYMDDIEVAGVMEKLRKRIGELEREVTVDEQREGAAEERAVMRQKLFDLGITDAALVEWSNSQANGGGNGSLSAEQVAALNAAKALLSMEEGQDLSAVHSTKSIASMLLLKQAKENISNIKNAVTVHTDPPAEPKVYNEPKVVTHEPGEGSRLENKKDISKLPYMNRNPAV